MSVNRRMRHRLELQALELEELFIRNGLEAQVEGGLLEPQGVTFQVHLNGPLSPSTQKQIQADVKDTFPGAALSTGAGSASLRVTLKAPDELNLCTLLEDRLNLAARMALLGYSTSQTPLILNFADASLEHVIFLGGEGAGKTSALRTCAVSMALSSRQSQIQMLFIDPQCDRPEMPLGPGLQALHYLPHALAAVVTDSQDAAEVLGYLEEEAGYRRTHAVRSPTIALFIDNVDALLDDGMPALRDAFQKLLARGAESGIHCIMAARPAQTGSSDELSKMLALKPVLRIVGAVGDSKQAEAATLLAQTGVENLLGKGDFVLARDDQPVRFQAAYVDSYDLHWCLESLQRARPPSIIARPASARAPLHTPRSISGETHTFSFDGRKVSVDQDAEAPLLR